MTRTELPLPARERWQPQRLGLVDLFLYDQAEFWFRDGHLLLRGNNGTGKSKVLALTLPFLLDGELSASRVEPDGDSSKRMEWNLLVDGRYPERLGYSWLEFGRCDDSGAPLFLTVGCGIKAVGGRGIVDRWFFVSEGRIGREFTLVGPGGSAHTRERLAEALEGIGHVYRRAEEYRRAIDERLFHLGPDRYDALINLLIQLRQPQLSRRPDEDKLSRALSESLKPVDQAILNVVAAAFHDLEQQREDLHALRETHTEVDRFLGGYRRYASVAARRLARDVRSSHSTFQASQRELAEIRQELERAEAEDQSATQARRQVQEELAGARGRAAELRDSREVRELDAAERLAQMAAQQAHHAGVLQAEAMRELDRQRAALERQRAAAKDAERQLQPVLAEVDRAAAVATLPPAPPELVTGLSPTAGVSAADAGIAAAENLAAASARRRSEATRHMRMLIERYVSAMDQVEIARKRLHELMAERDSATDLLSSARQDLEVTTSLYVDGWRSYLRSLSEVPRLASDDVLERIAVWSETLDGPDPGAAFTANAADGARNALSELRAAALAHQNEITEVLELLRSERERLLQGEILVPPTPYTRDPSTRTARAGAPLWQLIDFRPEVVDEHRAGFEAALESAGILDAWLTPDGQLLAHDTHDVMLVAGAPLESASSLIAVLEPAIDRAQPGAAAVSDETVQRLLSSIGRGEGTSEIWVDKSGHWRLGILDGRWNKPNATFIGRGARDAARRHRIAELANEIDLAERGVEGARLEVMRIEQRQHTLAEELARMPSADTLRERHRGASEAQRRLAASEARTTDHERVVANFEDLAQAAFITRDDAAADLKLPTTAASLETVSQAIGDYGVATAGLWPRVRHLVERLSQMHESIRDLEQAESARDERTRRADEASRGAREERGRWEGLRASIGATVEQIQHEVETISARMRALEHETQRLEEVRRACANRLGRAQDSQVRIERSLSEQAGRRSTAISTLERFAANGLLLAAVPELELPTGGWSPDPAARLARRVEQTLESVDDDDQAWERLRREISTLFKNLQDGMTRYGYSAILDPVDGWHVVTIAFNGQQRSPAELVALLSDEIEHRERLLSARERELLEEHLVNEIASHLQELIHDAEVQVHHMNQELSQRPTSTGMHLRFRWMPRADGPAGLPEARARLMRQVQDAWSVDDRAAVSAFLKAQIDAVRAANENGTWLDHLTEALDYRRWHCFSIERRQDGHWRAASGPASSGEKVLTVTLPLFAAASAHYRSAHPLAPRLVLMDEVFAGVDDDSRSKSIGLLDTFDLDFVMTSEREWGCYATLPGLAIYQLARREGIDAVHVTEWTWDGRVRSRVDRTPASASPQMNGVGTNGHVHNGRGQ